jgi:hypothetical protein
VEKIKTLLYSALIYDLEILQQQAENARQEIRVKPGIFQRKRNSFRRRAEICVKMYVNHREYLP